VVETRREEEDVTLSWSDSNKNPEVEFLLRIFGSADKLFLRIVCKDILFSVASS
jgi:hypothetical protein